MTNSDARMVARFMHVVAKLQQSPKPKPIGLMMCATSASLKRNMALCVGHLEEYKVPFALHRTCSTVMVYDRYEVRFMHLDDMVHRVQGLELVAVDEADHLCAWPGWKLRHYAVVQRARARVR
jgi:hypothetical protein